MANSIYLLFFSLIFSLLSIDINKRSLLSVERRRLKYEKQEMSHSYAEVGKR